MTTPNERMTEERLPMKDEANKAENWIDVRSTFLGKLWCFFGGGHDYSEYSANESRYRVDGRSVPESRLHDPKAQEAPWMKFMWCWSCGKALHVKATKPRNYDGPNA